MAQLTNSFEIGLAKASEPLVLALDVGSTASRGSHFDATGRPVKPREKRPHAFSSSASGASYIDPDQVCAELIPIIDELVDAAGSKPISAVALDSFASSLVGVDEKGRALTPCITYNDARCASQVDWLRKHGDEDEIQNLTGCRFHSSYLPARLRWLAQTKPEVWLRVRRWMSIGEYCYLQLLGKAEAGMSTAAWTGLLDRASGQWSQPALELAGIKASQLNPVVAPEKVLHSERGCQAWQLWPQLRQASWFAPLGDGYSSTLGLQPEPNEAVINLATSGAMRILLPDPVGDEPRHLPRGLWSYRVDNTHSLIGGATNDVGRATAWLANNLLLPEAEELTAALTAPPAANTPLVLPFFSGERSTGWHDSAKVTITGLTSANTATQLYRGALEGVVWSFDRIQDELAHCISFKAARLGGRVSNEAPGLVELLSHGLGLAITPVTIKRSTLRGTALVALNVIAPQVARCEVETGPTQQPNPSYASYFVQAFASLDELYKKTVTA